MSSNNRDKDMPSVIQWDGTSSLPFKEWKRAILDTGAERTDESGSSVADVFTGADMGGTAVGAPPLPAGVAQLAQKMQARLARPLLIAFRGLFASCGGRGMHAPLPPHSAPLLAACAPVPRAALCLGRAVGSCCAGRARAERRSPAASHRRRPVHHLRHSRLPLAQSYSKGHVPIQHREFVSDQSKRRRYWARSYVGYGYFSRARPNAAHFAVSALQERGLLRGGIITQNVDGLHSAAGASGVLDLHGRIDEVECLNCGALTPRAALQERLAGLNAGWLERAGVAAVAQAAMRADGDAALSDEACASFVVPECGACGGGPLKPTVTFFGGTVPPAIVEASKAAAAAADAVLVAGSSVATFSAFRLVKRVAEDRKPVAVLNIGPSRADPLASLAVSADVATVLPALVGGLYGQQAEAEVWRSAAAARSRAETSANK